MRNAKASGPWQLDLKTGAYAAVLPKETSRRGHSIFASDEVCSKRLITNFARFSINAAGMTIRNLQEFHAFSSISTFFFYKKLAIHK